jgi:hypothetical protein
VAFRTFAMRDGLRRAITATPLRQSISEWPSWAPEVLTYVALFGQGLPNPSLDRMDSASYSRVLAVSLHKDALAAAAAAEGLHSDDTRASIPKLATLPGLVCHGRAQSRINWTLRFFLLMHLCSQVFTHESCRLERGSHFAAAQGSSFFVVLFCI